MLRNEQEVMKHERPKSRVIVFRCSDTTFLDVLDYIKTSKECFLVYSKTSTRKIMVSEEEWPL